MTGHQFTGRIPVAEEELGVVHDVLKVSLLPALVFTSVGVHIDGHVLGVRTSKDCRRAADGVAGAVGVVRRVDRVRHHLIGLARERLTNGSRLRHTLVVQRVVGVASGTSVRTGHQSTGVSVLSTVVIPLTVHGIREEAIHGALEGDRGRLAVGGHESVRAGALLTIRLVRGTDGLVKSYVVVADLVTRAVQTLETSDTNTTGLVSHHP